MCAIFGITNHEEASKLVYLGLHAQQHRGQEGAGIVSSNTGSPHCYKKSGLVSEVFTDSVLNQLTGESAIGHTRYSTAGDSSENNLGPILRKYAQGWLAISHNGNLSNAAKLSAQLESEGAIFQATNDTEIFIHLIARSKKTDLIQSLTETLRKVEGAYSLLVMNSDYLIAVRDPIGFRPLVVGELNGKKMFASETCAFNLINAQYLREIQPGEMYVVYLKENFRTQSFFPFENKPTKKCVFEYVYFAKPDSNVFNKNVYSVRKDLGKKLADEHPAHGAEVIIPVPDSGVPAAIGFSEQSKIPFDMGIIRSHYVGRTFIEPKQSIRDFGVKLKLNAVKSIISNKEIVVVDDSLVRGTTSKKLVRMLREAGAKKIHMRISAPPTTHSCFYGIDTPSRNELIASKYSIDAIREFIGADTLGYLSLEGLLEVSGNQSFCHACFSGEYPTAT